MGSERLPGKSVMVLDGQPILDSLMQRLEELECEKWLATSESKEDDALSDIAKGRGWRILRGSKDNVLSRFEKILINGDSSYCIRVTGDNPLVCPKGLIKMIQTFNSVETEIDYMSDFDFGFYPVGAFAEIFSVSKFLSGLKGIPILEPWHLAHVTSWMRKTTRISPLALPLNFEKRPGWRWTIDYPEDFEFMTKLIKELGNSWTQATYPEILEVLEQNPELTKINSHLHQKPIELG